MEEIILKGIDEKVYIDKCDNGLDIVMWVNERVNNYYLTLDVKYGSIDTEFKVGNKSIKVPDGIAHFIEHIKFNVDEGVTANDFFNQYGVSINAFTTFKYTGYEVFGNSNFDECLGYLLDYVYNPYFTKEIVEKEKGIISEEVKMTMNNPTSKLYFGANKAVFKKDKYRNLVTGSSSDVEEIKLDDVLNVYNNFYHPSNMFLVITGNFNPFAAAALVKKKMRELKFNEFSKPEVIKVKEPKEVNKRKVLIEAGVEIPKAKIIYKVPLKNFKGYSNLELKTYMGMILRANFGSSSDLKEELMEKDLISYLGYSRDIIGDYLVIYLDVESNYLDDVIDLLINKFNNLEMDKEMVERRIRTNIASLINDFDDIEFVSMEFQDEMIEYGKIIDDAYDVNKKFDIKIAKDLISKIDYDNYSVVKMVPEVK